MAFAASWTTYSLSVTAICRLNLSFKPSSAWYIDWLNDRSFLALGRMSATLSGLADEPGDPPAAAVGAGAVVELVFEELLPQADATSVAPRASGTSHLALDMTERMGILLVGFTRRLSGTACPAQKAPGS